MVDEISLDIQEVSTVIIFPQSKRENPVSIPLSIFDNATAGFSRCAAVWFYGPRPIGGASIDASHYELALSITLNTYRQWCGRLSYAADRDNGTHNERYQRIWVTYNTPSDVGIPFTEATSPRTLSDILLETSARSTSSKAWDASSLPSSELLPDVELAMSADAESSNMAIQHTTFACGSTALGIQITHCLADAQSLAQFAKDWSATSRALLAGLQAPELFPVFDPQRLDAFAAGDIDSTSPDAEKLKEARALPQHRYNWYKQAPDQPWPLKIPADFPHDAILSPSDPIPWRQWDTKAPVFHRVIHFSKPEIEHIYQIATAPRYPGVKISKHDALLAHIWSRITTARNLKSGTTSWLDMTFGLRARVYPPLPASFLGSPITHAAIPYSVTSSLASLSQLANIIRTTLSIFTPFKIAALLHDKAFEVAPQRLWHACLGREHILLTTWVHSGVYDVVFEEEREVKYVHAVMPVLDGLVEVMEAPKPTAAGKGGSWIENGVDVNVYLEAKAMERLLVDDSLWCPR